MPVDIDKTNTAAEINAPISRGNLIMPDRERIERERSFEEVAHSGSLRMRLRICELPLTQPRAAPREIAHIKPIGSEDGIRQTTAVKRFGLGAAGRSSQVAFSARSEFTPRGRQALIGVGVIGVGTGRLIDR